LVVVVVVVLFMPTENNSPEQISSINILKREEKFD
jgi:hypothetical protein